MFVNLPQKVTNTMFLNSYVFLCKYQKIVLKLSCVFKSCGSPINLIFYFYSFLLLCFDNHAFERQRGSESNW